MIKLKPLIIEGFGDKTDLDKETEDFRQSLIHQYPQLESLFFNISYRQDIFHLRDIKIKKEFRKQGIGRKVIEAIKSFADKHGLIITLSPEAEKRYKKKLDKFYKSLGFIHNRGRKKDYSLSSFFGPTMFRRPEIKKLNEAFEIPLEIEKQVIDITKSAAGYIIEAFLKSKKYQTKSPDMLQSYVARSFGTLAHPYKIVGNKYQEIKSGETLKPFKSPNGEMVIMAFPIKIKQNMFFYRTPSIEGEGYFKTFWIYFKAVETYEEYNSLPKTLGGTDYYDSGKNAIYITFCVEELIEQFNTSMERKLRDVKHEVRHLLQDILGHTLKKFRKKFPKKYGLSKKSLRWFRNPSIRGVDVFGTVKEPGDKFNRIEHELRDIEFKTNLYDYKNNIEIIISKFWPTNKKEGFRALIDDIAGHQSIHPHSVAMLYWAHSDTRKKLKRIYELDKPKFIQYVKELYKLIFGNIKKPMSEIMSPYEQAKDINKRRGYIGVVYHGNIEAYDEMVPDVMAVDHSELPHGRIGSTSLGTRWRYFVETPKNTILWNEFPPTDEDRHKAEDWLVKKGIYKPQHIGLNDYKTYVRHI
jgi:hypothetical protein